MWTDLCQINFRGCSLDFDLILSRWDWGCVPLIQHRAISLRLTDTKPTSVHPVTNTSAARGEIIIWPTRSTYLSYLGINAFHHYLNSEALIPGHEWRNTINLPFTFWYLISKYAWLFLLLQGRLPPSNTHTHTLTQLYYLKVGSSHTVFPLVFCLRCTALINLIPIRH